MDSSPLARQLSRSGASIQPSNSRRRVNKPDSSQAWTSARCQRLLRQLQARLAALRRSKYQQISERSIKPKREASSRDDGTTTTTTTTATTSKRVRLTYGQRDRPLAPAAPREDTTNTTPPRPTRALRAMRPDRSSPASGPANFRTPLWNRLRARTETPLHDSSGQRYPAWIEEEPFEDVPSHISERMCLLKQSLPDAQHRLYEAILEWVNALLHSTAPRTQGLRPKSLLAMCLRRVPACIAGIEAWERGQVNDRGSRWDSSLVAFDMYDQLEEFGLRGFGWRPLSLVVRSHAIAILSDAVSEGLFHPVFTGLLIRLCTHLGCLEAGAKLACAVREALPGPRGPMSRLHEHLQLGPLYSLVESAKGPTGSIFESLTTLLHQRWLPYEWLCTVGFTKLWSSNSLIMTSKHPKPSDYRFKQTALVVLLGQCEKKAQDPKRIVAEKTLLGLLAGTTAMLLSVEDGMGGRPLEISKQACRRLLHLLDGSIAQMRPTRCRNGLFILTLARCLAAMDSCVVDDGYRQQAADDFQAVAVGIDASAERDARYRRMISLIYEIVLCLRRSFTFVGLGEMSRKMDKLSLPSPIVTAVRKDVAFMVAKQTKSLQDLAFAESLPSASESSGWRWEEGISEWVVDTDRDVSQPPANEATALSIAARKRSLRSQSRKQDTVPSGDGAAQASASGSDDSRGQRRGTRSFGRVNTPPAPAASKRSLIRTRIRPALTSLSQARAADDEGDDDELL